MQHYLGPDRPLTILSTWDEVVAAAEGGLLGENRWCELKATLPPSDKKSNTELARDLAALAVYGGALIIGVNDDEQVVGTGIDGMVSRISQVAATRIEPPLSPVIHDPIEGPDGKFVLIVSVPPSSVRPHMVDDVYWGRSSDGKRKLGDAEVRSLMMERASSEETFRARLLGMVARDPLVDFIENHPTGNGHIYLVAEPCAPVPPLPDDLDVRDLAKTPRTTIGWQGNMSNCNQQAFDPEGEAYTTHRGEPLPAKYERNLCWFSVKDRDTSVEVVSGGGSARWERAENNAVEYAIASLITGLTVQMLAFVRLLSQEVGYLGQWRVGIHVTNLRGRVVNSQNLWANHPRYAADDYTHTRIVAVSTLEDVETEAKGLLRGLHRGLGLDGWSVSQVMNGV